MTAVLELCPCTISRAVVIMCTGATRHRHNDPPRGGLFAVAVRNRSDFASDPLRLRGVAIVGRPVARGLNDGATCEVLRVSTDGAPNACSMLYGACVRAARALGYRRVVTYTLAGEPGTSLRAAGMRRVAAVVPRPTWSCRSRPREQRNLFGHERRPAGAKWRWEWTA